MNLLRYVYSRLSEDLLLLALLLAIMLLIVIMPERQFLFFPPVE